MPMTRPIFLLLSIIKASFSKVAGSSLSSAGFDSSDVLSLWFRPSESKTTSSESRLTLESKSKRQQIQEERWTMWHLCSVARMRGFIANDFRMRLEQTTTSGPDSARGRDKNADAPLYLLLRRLEHLEQL